MLVYLSLLALMAGILAFRIKRFTGHPVWHATDYLSTMANGRVYATYGLLFTSSGATLFISTTGTPALIYKTTAFLPPFTVMATAIDGSGLTTSILTYSATLTLTRVVTYF